MKAVAVALFRGLSWTCWLIADALDSTEAEFARLDAQIAAGES